MCLYPKLIRNPKYIPNKKNGGRPPQCKDKRTMLIPVGCQKCMECMKQKANGWKIRLLEEIKTHNERRKHFVTLTFNTEALIELNKEIPETITGYERDNAIATLAVRRFTERWRERHGKAPRHWLITELGHDGTEHLHLHGIIFEQTTEERYNKKTGKKNYYDTTKEELGKMWKYGHIWTGTYVNEATVGYIIKYCTKMDAQHKQYKPKIYTSKGIGRNYVSSTNAQLSKYKPKQTRDVYRTREGYKLGLPAYYRNKLYTEEEREKLWVEKIEKQERWVDGSRISIAHGEREYVAARKAAREKNQRLGYGNDEKNWEEHKYENDRRTYLHGERLQTNRDNKKAQSSETLQRQGNVATDNGTDATREWIRKMAEGSRNEI